MISTPCNVSIVIPAYNEQDYIGVTLASIRKYAPTTPYEIIVVDNGSNDNTVEIVHHYLARVVNCPEGTIAAVRNKGVSESRGDILVFLDADVLVTKKWQEGIGQVVNQLLQTPMLITGSRCGIPNRKNWINHYWFKLLATNNAPYINSGHLITTRQLFDKVGGFSEHLLTAEDYDFCQKSKTVGAKISPSLSIPVVHEGYPETIRDFIQRECWHGKEDFKSIQSILKSKVAWIAIFHVLLFLFCGLYVVLNKAISSLFVYPLVMFTISLCLTVIKFGWNGLIVTINTSGIFYLYILGRTLAFFYRIFNKEVVGFR